MLGAGTNRMNVYVIRRASSCTVLRDRLAVFAIGHDSRIKSDVFAREAAAVFAANGITAYLYPRLAAGSALSFAVRHLHGLGVYVTASHNPAEYNGYKAHGADGCQYDAGGLSEAWLRCWSTWTILPAQKPWTLMQRCAEYPVHPRRGTGCVCTCCLRSVSAAETRQSEACHTPLNGAGLECVKKLTQKLDREHDRS